MKKKSKKGAASKKTKQESTETAAEASTAVDDKPTEDDKPKEQGDDTTKDEGDTTSPPVETTLAQQSKLRSTSFRSGSIASGAISPGPFSPDGETAPDIYRKHVAKIEELEKENKRLAKEASDSEKRWQKAEEELADLREAEDEDEDAAKGGSSDEIEKLVRPIGLNPWETCLLTI